VSADRRIVLTRQAESNRPWAARLRAAGHAVLELPLVRFRELAVTAEPPATDWLLFTSPQGVRAFTAAGLTVGEARVAALGTGTTAALAAAGLTDDLELATRDGAELAAAFSARVTAPATVLLPGPRKRLTEPRATLEAAGFTVSELALYETEVVPADDLTAAPWAEGDIVFFCSPSAVRAFTGAWDARPACVAIGETTADALRAAGFAPAVADRPDLEAMVLAAGLDPIPAPASTERES
jgi:uroporphyrinogen-III synthase